MEKGSKERAQIIEIFLLSCILYFGTVRQMKKFVIINDFLKW